MCGRFVQKSDRERLQRFFNIPRQLTVPDDLPSPSYNVAPTQPIQAVVQEGNARLLTAYRWGLVPAWADDPSIGSRMINARSESANEKPAFRNAFRSRRCLIPSDGFYEWKKAGGEKIPYFIHGEGEEPLAFAGLWEVNQKFSDPLTTCTILTTAANPSMSAIHDRMPVILLREDYDHWLDPDADPEALLALLRPYEGDDLALHPVSKRVNSPRNNDPSLIEPVEDVPPLTLFDAAPDADTRNPK